MSLWDWQIAAKAVLSSIGPIAVLDTPFSPYRILRSSRSYIFAAYAVLSFLVFTWSSLVTRIVPEPYLDEVFHIPQAQAYCDGRYDVWDPKLTTPPGLYVFATVFTKIYRIAQCSPWGLRMFNAVTSLMILAYASDCRALITFWWKQNSGSLITTWKKANRPLSPESIHTALNIALFPPLFFFSGLFYTDVLSTCLVLRTYRLYLERQGVHERSAKGLFWIYPTGMIALTMRQTNIFWVAVFVGGLEAIRTLKSDTTPQSGKIKSSGADLNERAMSLLEQYSRGKIHDPHLNDAGVPDFILCVVSLAVAAISHPFKPLARLWPYILLLISFTGFLFWNGGVVLGDKSSHIATIHLAQLLYIWPLIVFFSFPILIPIGIRSLLDLDALLSMPQFPRLMWKYFFVTLLTGIAFSSTLFVIKFSTIIHPFTLADNRHYMFYVFRYTILRHPYVRFMLAPIYLGCGWLVYLTLCTPSVLPTGPKFRDKNGREGKVPASAVKKESPEGPTVSFVIVLLLTTALSLVGAPLVEPRYFILPWVIWRLNCPPLPSKPTSLKQPKSARSSDGNLVTIIKNLGWDNYDYRLWTETAWFMLVNVVTGYVFLYRGFEWRQEPGKVQRFMW